MNNQVIDIQNPELIKKNSIKKIVKYFYPWNNETKKLDKLGDINYFYYDENGMMQKQETSGSESYNLIFIYDENSNVIEVKISEKSGPFETLSQYSYKYESSVIKQRIYKVVNASFETVESFDYDSRGNLSLLYTSDLKSIGYQYNEDNLLIRNDLYNIKSETDKIGTYFTYEYDKNNHLNKVYCITSDIKVLVLDIRYEYNQKGNKIIKSEYRSKLGNMRIKYNDKELATEQIDDQGKTIYEYEY